MNEQERADYFRLPRGATPESINPASEQGAAYVEMLATREQAEIAAQSGLMPAELQRAEDVAMEAASASLAAGLSMQEALQAGSDAGLETVRAILRNRRDALIKLATDDHETLTNERECQEGGQA
jgi:hypothetical protein